MNATIRRAQPDDVVRIAQMLRRFYATHGKVYDIPYDHGSCMETVLKCIDEGVTFTGSGSCAGALIIPFPFNHKARVATVVFWYAENRRELYIFDLLLAACREAGATHINASTLSPHHTGKRFYAVRGMALAEHQYIGGTTVKSDPVISENSCTVLEKA